MIISQRAVVCILLCVVLYNSLIHAQKQASRPRILKKGQPVIPHHIRRAPGKPLRPSDDSGASSSHKFSKLSVGKRRPHNPSVSYTSSEEKLKEILPLVDVKIQEGRQKHRNVHSTSERWTSSGHRLGTGSSSSLNRDSSARLSTVERSHGERNTVAENERIREVNRGPDERFGDADRHVAGAGFVAAAAGEGPEDSREGPQRSLLQQGADFGMANSIDSPTARSDSGASSRGADARGVKRTSSDISGDRNRGAGGDGPLSSLGAVGDPGDDLIFVGNSAYTEAPPPSPALTTPSPSASSTWTTPSPSVSLRLTTPSPSPSPTWTTSSPGRTSLPTLSDRGFNSAGGSNPPGRMATPRQASRTSSRSATVAASGTESRTASRSATRTPSRTAVPSPSATAVSAAAQQQPVTTRVRVRQLNPVDPNAPEKAAAAAPPPPSPSTSPSPSLSPTPLYRNGIMYNGGPLMNSGVVVYFIWYGNWTASRTTELLESLAKVIGFTPWWDIASTYYDSKGVRVPRGVALGGSYYDKYSQGPTLDDKRVWGAVTNALTNKKLPLNDRGVYFVLSSADVNEESGWCSSYCGYHSYSQFGGINVKYAFVGNPVNFCPSACIYNNELSINNDPPGDAIASSVAHELVEAVTDPLVDGWIDPDYSENADKCAYNFGPNVKADEKTGAEYNLVADGRRWLIQTNWVNARGGFCSMSPT